MEGGNRRKKGRGKSRNMNRGLEGTGNEVGIDGGSAGQGRELGEKVGKVTEQLKTKSYMPWLVWLSGLSASLRTKGLPVRFQSGRMPDVQASTLPPSWGRTRGNHTLTFLSLSFSFLFPLCKNK